MVVYYRSNIPHIKMELTIKKFECHTHTIVGLHLQKSIKLGLRVFICTWSYSHDPRKARNFGTKRDTCVAYLHRGGIV